MYKRQALDLFTGAWDPKTQLPYPDSRPWPVRLMPWVLLVSAAFISMALTLPPVAPHDYQVRAPVPIFPLLWAVVAAGSLVYIWQHGVQYVGWPTLNRPERIIFYDGPGYYSGRHGRKGLETELKSKTD